MNEPDLEGIDIFTKWVGFSNPPCRVAKLVISRKGDVFEREMFPDGPIDQLSSNTAESFLKALALPVVPQLDPALFDLPESVIRNHYGSCWTDDSPAHLVKVRFQGGQSITVQTDVQQAFMLPLTIQDSRAASVVRTFDPRLSQAIANLMPDGYPDKSRLAGQLGMLQFDLEELESRESTSPEMEPAESLPEEGESSDPIDFGNLFQKLWGEESPEEKAAAIEAGKWSERLLKQISFEEMQECFENGADPSCADDAGQTALMHAARPPFEPRRFRLLVKAGANVGACRNDGLNGLQIACLGGEAPAAAEWIRAGANIHGRTPEGATPLMLAARWTQIVQLLLSAGADVNAVDEDGHSALVYAIVRPIRWESTDSAKTVKALIEAGADLNRRDREGISPLGHARRVLNRINLEEEVFRAFHPKRKSFECEQKERKLVQSIVDLIWAAGGRD